MDYKDPYNVPEQAIRDYSVAGGEIDPDLAHGTIFRVNSESSFTMNRLANQMDGAKFFLEVVNIGDSGIHMSLNSDYRNTALEFIDPIAIASGGVKTLEIICRLGLMLVYNTTGSTAPADALKNPDGGVVLINPATGQQLLNPQ